MPEAIVDRVLRLVGYGVREAQFEESSLTARLWLRQAAGDGQHTCSGCGVGCSSIVDVHERVVRDLPWGAWKVWLVLEVHRVRCRRCGVRSERFDFVEGKHPYTRRFAAAVARDAEDAAVRRVALKWGLSPQTVARIDKRALQAWQAGRRRRPLRQMGVDELYWKVGECLTIVSDLELGEPIWAAPGRKKETLDRFFAEALPPARRRAVRAVCVDMYQPFQLSLREHLPGAVIVFDKFHVMKHVQAAVDETRRAEFFRQKGLKRALVRGKRWLFLSRWHNLERDERRVLRAALALNRPLFKAYFLKEDIERLWTYTYEGAARRFFQQWVRAIRWQRLPAFKKLVATLQRHLDGILSYCRHKVPFGVVEAINGNLRALIRRGRGYRDHDYLLLKARRSTAQARLQKAA
jgi:transposase